MTLRIELILFQMLGQGLGVIYRPDSRRQHVMMLDLTLDTPSRFMESRPRSATSGLVSLEAR